MRWQTFIESQWCLRTDATKALSGSNKMYLYTSEDERRLLAANGTNKYHLEHDPL